MKNIEKDFKERPKGVCPATSIVEALPKRGREPALASPKPPARGGGGRLKRAPRKST